MLNSSSLILSSFPRARGDVPTVSPTGMVTPKFSPRTRGCSPLPNISQGFLNVFPAHAGMFLDLGGEVGKKPSFPRARGDVPAGQKRWRP